MPNIEKKTIVSEIKKEPENKEKREFSALSLKSIQRKKEAEVTQKKEAEADKNLPEDSFDIIKAKKYWKEYIEKLSIQGKKSMVSIMKSNEITVNGNTIHLELPNSLMESQLKMQQTSLLQFLREKLNNYKILLQVNVNEEVSKKFVYTPQEKYEKLKEKNKSIELLRKTFHLDL